MSYEYERVATPASGLRLHLNENTAGCSPAALDAIRSLTRTQVAEYPDYDAALAAAATRLGVEPGSLLLTNGLDEGILAAALLALRGAGEHGEAIVVVPAFDMYAACTDAVGGRVIEVPLGPGFEFPLEGVLSAISDRTRLVWLTNPNNPTGQSIPREAIVRIAAAAARSIVFVDEAYADFGGETFVGDPALRQFPRMVVGRTFAKAYGLAGYPRRRGRRRTSDDSGSAAGDASVQSQCRRGGRDGGGIRRCRVLRLVRRSGRELEDLALSRLREFGRDLLEERREFRAREV